MVIHRGKILALYKSYKNRYEGWVLPKGTVEPGETYEQTALREVREESGVRASIVKYVGKSQYNFTVPEDMVTKEVQMCIRDRAVTEACETGCIGCKKCEKNCPAGAITVTDFCAHIDYSKCTNCGKCREVCPRGCIRS